MRRLLILLMLFASLANAQTLKSIIQTTYPASGTNTYTATIPGFIGYGNGMEVKIKFTNANTGAATININDGTTSLGAKTLQKNGAALSSGDIAANGTYRLSYDGTNFQVLGLSSGGGGASLPFADNVTLFKNNTDNTKTLKFDLSGITTSTLRTVSWPDYSGIALLDGDNFTTKSSMSFNVQNATNSSLQYVVSNGGTKQGYFFASASSTNTFTSMIVSNLSTGRSAQFSVDSTRATFTSTDLRPMKYANNYSTNILLDNFSITDIGTVKDGVFTFTNKTISGASNTITNLSASNLSSGLVATARGGTGVDNSTGGTANTFWARPNGATGAATYRAIVAADIPTLPNTQISGLGTLSTLNSLTNGSGTTANGTAVDIGGALTSAGVFTGSQQIRFQNFNSTNSVNINPTYSASSAGTSALTIGPTITSSTAPASQSSDMLFANSRTFGAASSQHALINFGNTLNNGGFNNGTWIGYYYNPTLTGAGTGTTHYAAVFGSGNVGIGTLAPSSLLTVNGAAAINSLTLTTALPVSSGGTGTATPSLVAGTNVTISGTWPNQTINATGSGSSLSNVIGTDANITAAVQTRYYLPSATLTAGRNFVMPTANNGDVIKVYNNEAGFIWTLTGQPVYLSDNNTILTQFLVNANYEFEYVNGRWRILN